ncbi:MAG: SDR family oxidoreductase [Deltaproteobacteria bacterium]|nr:MAG: SDR family oxidoreductase [Deltaproteobacteria bacterium]
MADILVIGCGDIGVRVARLHRQRGDSVHAVVRSQERAMHLEEAERIATVPGNLDSLEALIKLAEAVSGKLVYYFAPPPGGGPWDSRMRNFCAALDRGHAPARVVYISTSGVYGDCGGGWVTEETPVNATTSRARRRLDAETVLRERGAQLGFPVVILRVTGIYGPGRLPLARLQEGHPVVREAEAPPTNRIHADDLATVCVAAAEQGADGEIFNVSDGQPGTMTQYFNAAADLLGLPRPPQVSMAEARQVMSPMMLSYLTETRRMDNRRMRERLGVVLRYPDLESGLRDVIEQLGRPDMGYLGSIGHG